MLPPPQCPNPACPPGTIRTRTGRIFVRYGESELKRLLHSWLAGFVLAIILSFGLIVIVNTVLSDILELEVGVFKHVLALFIIVVVTQGVFYVQGLHAHIVVQQQRCRRCKYRWFNREPDPVTNELYAHWAEGELASARARGKQAQIGIFASTIAGYKIMYENNCTESLKLLDEAVVILRLAGDRAALGYVLNDLGAATIYCDQSVDPRPLIEESIAILREHQEWNGLAHALNSLGDALLHAGDPQRAKAPLAEALLLNLKLGKVEGVDWALRGMAIVASASGDARRAARLFGAAEALRGAFQLPIMMLAQPFLEHHVEAARQQTSTAEWDMAWAEGRAMPPDQAAQYALGT